MEGARQIMARAGNGDVMLLHRLQQGRLGARTGAVDLVRHQQLAEDRARHEAELAAPLLALIEHFRAQYVGGHEVWGELDAFLLQAEHPAKRGRELGLGETRRTDQQTMTPGQDGGERQVDDLGLAEDHLANGFAHLFQAAGHLVKFGDNMLFSFIDACHGAHYSLGQPGCETKSGGPNAKSVNEILVNKHGLMMTKPERDAGNPLAGLKEAEFASGKKGMPPVHLWNPPFCGDIDMRIAQDGLWYYLNSPIGRKPLMKLFASVLRLDEDGKYYLVTPVEKCGIRVDDAPFVAIRMSVEGQGRDQSITFETNTDDIVTIDAAHPMRVAVEANTGGLKPYVLVRGRLEALISRALFYDLVALGTVEGEWFGVWSGGRFWPMQRAAEIGAVA